MKKRTKKKKNNKRKKQKIDYRKLADISDTSIVSEENVSTYSENLLQTTNYSKLSQLNFFLEYISL